MNNEVMKSTGELLEVKDYIKNYLFDKASKLSTNEEEELKNLYAKNIEGIFSHDWFNPSDFYRSFIIDMHPSHIIIRRENRELFSAFKEIWKGTNLNTFAELKKIILTIYHKALIYDLAWQPVNTIVVSNFESVRKTYYKSLLQVSHMYIPIYTQLSFACTNIKNNELNWNQPFLNEMDILNIIARLSLFRDIVKAPGRNIVRSIPKYYDEFRKTGMMLTVENFVDFLNQINILPSEEMVINGLLELYPTSRIAKYVLLAAELSPANYSWHNFEISKIWTEYILPIKDERWEEDFKNQGRMVEFLFFCRRKRHIANLTILPLRINSSVSSSPYSDKAEIIKMRCDLHINKVFYEFKKYDLAFLNARMEFIIMNFAKFFNIRGYDGFERIISKWRKNLNSLMQECGLDGK